MEEEQLEGGERTSLGELIVSSTSSPFGSFFVHRVEALSLPRVAVLGAVLGAI